MRKKSIGLLTALLLYFTCPAACMENDIKIVVNGNLLYTDAAPVVIDDRTMLPIRAICEALGCNVQWDASAQTAVVSNLIDIIYIQIGIGYITKTSRHSNVLSRIEVEVPPLIIDERTLVPVRAIAESLGAAVKWDGDANMVYIDTSAAYMDETIENDVDYTPVYNNDTYEEELSEAEQEADNDHWFVDDNNEEEGESEPS